MSTQDQQTHGLNRMGVLQSGRFVLLGDIHPNESTGELFNPRYYGTKGQIIAMGMLINRTIIASYEMGHDGTS
jgi:hypothetical protein